MEHKVRISEDPSAPCVYLVHGRAGDASVMWTFKQAIPEHFSIISPQGIVPDPIGGFSWWRIDQDSFGTREYAVERLKLFLSEVEGQYKIQPRKRIAIGFSQGAGLLSILLHRDPNCFDGVGLLSGFVVTGKFDSIGKPKAKIFLAHGEKDSVIPVEKARAGKEHLELNGFDVEYVEDPVDHKIGSKGMRGLKSWLASFITQH